MRVATKTVYDMVKFNLANITSDLNKANKIVSTAKRINAPSDDPIGLTQVLSIKSSLSNVEQLERNIAVGKSWLSASESSLNHVQKLISDAKALCIQMATATTGAPQRLSAAKAVQNIYEEIISLANTDVDGRYIFAGSETGTAPFDQNGIYRGNNTPFAVKIGRDAMAEVGNDGQEIFQPSGAGGTDDIFQTLKDLKSALENNDVSGIKATICSLDEEFDRISAKISDIGSKMVRMEVKEGIFQDLKLANTERLSRIQDADIAEAITTLKEKQVAYQAALASSAKIMELSLLDFL
ncbi:MAG: flagellar hook-associated protein FlgL [Deltaproteobacteria bacterium]|nr:flagellar hook-associated protein FlgL [Deltaproteobacteria bacterium]MBW1918623.1 flagellar hook-associated protein FlgL [Deltaproteobacteria bacterium]MBW1934063.1 flagellar hook-associated protein FlgL [Deltaproteobacteria bacterium]MBW1976365.1 flagellar hook-associated protein FlgL [Deltaproteobacteria bacterium]MBW2043357.1 flagellar hook-associated protein FlgL [Deltaproteobacteria bacterium]